MQKYTGANLKARALLALQDNPLRTGDDSWTGVKVNADRNEIHLHLSFENLRERIIGILPITDLAEIKAAMHANELLQSRWRVARMHDGDYMKEFRSAEDLMNDKVRATMRTSGDTTMERLQQVRKAVRAEFEPQFEDIRRRARAELAPAQPGMEGHASEASYMESLNARAEQQSGISRIAEAKLFRAPQAWHDEWTGFIAETNGNDKQKHILEAMRTMSESRIEIDDSVINGVLQKAGNPRLHFKAEDLHSICRFANAMAEKRPLFVEPEAEVEHEAPAPH